MLNVFRKGAQKAQLVRTLYDALTAQARMPAFFQAYGVADTIDGRFDMLALHAWLVFGRLRDAGLGEAARGLSDAIFIGFDEALRDLGTGDMGLGPRMKKLGNAFNGRLQAYEGASDATALRDALIRNVYRGEAGHEAAAAALADYALAARARLEDGDPAEGALDFGPVPTTFQSP